MDPKNIKSLKINIVILKIIKNILLFDDKLLN